MLVWSAVVGVPGTAHAATTVGTQLARLHACSCQYDGASVAVSGTTAVVGVPGIDDGAGRVFIYSDAGGSWKPTVQLVGKDTGSGDSFGNSVAMTSTTILVGAPAHGGYAGRAYVFALRGSKWQQVAELTGSDTAAGDWFGDSVALSGTTAVVGAPEHDGAVGAAYVFSGSSGTWSQTTKLTDTTNGGSGTAFGYSVAVDGSEALVGQPGTTGSGSAYIFDDAGGSWSLAASLEAPQPAGGDDFGNSVALQGDTAVVGAWLTEHGGAYVFSDGTGTWSETQQVQATDSEDGDDLGASVTLQGSTLVVGGTIDDGNIGVAYVFTDGSGSWQLAAQVAPPGNDGGDFFSNKALALDGTTLLVGSPGHAGGIDGGSSGSADLFSGSSASWSEVTQLSPSAAYSNQHFGTSLALSGISGVAGAPGFDKGAGRAYLITPDTTGTYVPTLSMVAFDTTTGDHFGASSAISGLTAVIGAPDHGDGRAYIFAETTAVPYTRGTVRCLPGTLPASGQLFPGECRAWTDDAELAAPDAAAGDAFGTSVAISGTTAVVGAPDHGGGRAYVFSDAGGSWGEVAELHSSNEGASDNFGASVAIDGSLLVVGATNHGGGRAYVFSDSSGAWTQVAQLAGSDTASGDLFATSVAIDAAGNVIAGAPGHRGGGDAYIFTDSSGTWSPGLEIVGSDTATGDAFGSSVGLGGSTAVVGAPGHSGRGSAYLFSGHAWGQAAELQGSSTSTGDSFGASVAVSKGVALVGEPNGYDNDSVGAGDGYAFEA